MRRNLLRRVRTDETARPEATSTPTPAAQQLGERFAQVYTDVTDGTATDIFLMESAHELGLALEPLLAQGQILTPPGARRRKGDVVFVKGYDRVGNSRLWAARWFRYGMGDWSLSPQWEIGRDSATARTFIVSLPSLLDQIENRNGLSEGVRRDAVAVLDTLTAPAASPAKTPQTLGE